MAQKRVTVNRTAEADCNGCRVCADICPKDAVSFERDLLTGCDMPLVDEKLCVNCGLCVKKCTQENPVRMPERIVGNVYAAWSKDDQVRYMSTSGGMFYELAKTMLDKNGAVVACCYTEDCRGAIHTIAFTKEDMLKQCGSKHMQSQTLHIYGKVGELLRNGRKVMFVGTPCEVAALYRYLDGDPENLVTADFICNSITSPKGQEKYIDYLEEKFGSKVISAHIKDKRNGWNNFGNSAKFEDGKEYYGDRNHDMRAVGYARGHLFIRESCLHCQYKELPRNADITFGDFWGIQEDARNPKLEMGTSVVIINSKKGQEWFLSLGNRVGFYEETMENAQRGNPAILKRATENGNRKKALAALDTMRFDRVVKKYIDRDSLMKKLVHKEKALIKLIIRRTENGSEKKK